MEERRRLERFELSAPAQVVAESNGDRAEQFDLTTKDVSSGGAFLFTSQPLPEGTRVSMEFSISLDMLRQVSGEKGRARVKVRGKVIRVEADGIAIQFEKRFKISALGNGNHRNNSF